MSITDELREWVSGAKPAVVDGCSISVGTMTYGCKKALLNIADRIDAEHERELRETGGDIVRDVRREWVRLPLDANGVPICVGDVLTDGEYTFVVNELAAFGGGSWSIRNEDGNAWKACDVTHHHEPTVEDVLREFAEKVIDSQIPNVHPTYEEAIAEFAAKLRLVGDAE